SQRQAGSVDQVPGTLDVTGLGRVCLLWAHEFLQSPRTDEARESSRESIPDGSGSYATWLDAVRPTRDHHRTGQRSTIPIRGPRVQDTAPPLQLLLRSVRPRGLSQGGVHAARRILQDPRGVERGEPSRGSAGGRRVGRQPRTGGGPGGPHLRI